MTDQRLHQAAARLRGGDASGAVTLVQDQLRDAPGDVEARHLLAMALGQLGRIGEAVEAFRAAADSHPQRGIVLANLGNLLRRTGRLAEAVAAYRDAARHAAGHLPAVLGEGLALQGLGRYEEARDALERVLEIKPEDPAALNALGLMARHEGDEPGALAFFDRALAAHPGAIAARVNRCALHRHAGRVEAALADAEQAVRVAPGSPDACLQLAQSLRAVNRPAEARSAFLAALQRGPGRTDIHRDFAHFLWEEGEQERFLGALDQAIEANPTAELLDLKARLCLRAGRLEAGLAAARRAVELDPSSPVALSGRGLLRRHGGDVQGAASDLEAALARAPGDFEIRHEYAEVLLAQKRFEDAGDVLVVDAPGAHLQRHIALRTLAWRAAGDARYRGYYDYDRLTAKRFIDVPDGYDSLETFNAALVRSIRRLHSSQSHPLDQTLFGGTQSSGRLWDVDDPVIQALGRALLKAASDYVCGLPDDPGHPFLGRKSDSLKLTGAWSVILRSGGGHVDHFHPAGWISASYYVSVPGPVLDGEKAGWLRLGASGVAGLDLAPEHYVRPEPGLAVFFPSYMWHGVEPFEADEDRITAPFDVVPAR